MFQDNRIAKSVDELDDILSTEKELDDSIVSSSSKRKTKEDSTTTGKKSRRTMSFGGARVKPDSLQLSVVGYDDPEYINEKKNERVTQHAYDKVSEYNINVCLNF